MIVNCLSEKRGPGGSFRNYVPTSENQPVDRKKKPKTVGKKKERGGGMFFIKIRIVI